MKQIVLKMKRSHNIKGYLFLLPSLIGTSIFSLFTFVDVLIRSFKEAMSGKFVGLNNYKAVINNKAFCLAADNTFRFTIICIPMLLIISILISYLLINIKKHGEFYKTSFLIPLSIPAASMMIIWKIFFSDNGLINKFINYKGGQPIAWLDSNYSFYVLILTYIWKNCGYDMVVWIAGLKNISSSIYEAASIDGCGRVQKFIYITLPNLKPAIFTVTAISLINSFKVFREAYLMCGSYPHDSIYMMQHLFNNWFIDLEVQKMCASAMMMAVVIFICIIIIKHFLADRM